jgi:hypothetical protein
MNTPIKKTPFVLVDLKQQGLAKIFVSSHFYHNFGNKDCLLPNL